MSLQSLPTAEFIMWAEKLANLPWPIPEQDSSSVAAKLDWQAGKLPHLYLTGLSNTGSFAFNERGFLAEVGFNLTNTDAHPTFERRLELHDAFIGYIRAAREVFGDPIRLAPHGRNEFWWQHSGGAIIAVHKGALAVSLLVTPPLNTSQD